MARKPTTKVRELSSEEKIAFATRVLSTVGVDDYARLQRGLELRKEMHAAQARGEVVMGYRIEWLHKTAQEVIRLVKAAGENFNMLHPDDKCSLLDFGDVLATATLRLGITKD